MTKPFQDLQSNTLTPMQNNFYSGGVAHPHGGDSIGKAMEGLTTALSQVHNKQVALSKEEAIAQRRKQNELDKRTTLDADTQAVSFLENKVKYYQQNPTDDYSKVAEGWDKETNAIVNSIKDPNQQYIYKKVYQGYRDRFLHSMAGETNRVFKQKNNESVTTNLTKKLRTQGLSEDAIGGIIDQNFKLASKSMTKAQYQQRLMHIAYANITNPDVKSDALFQYLKKKNMLSYDGSDSDMAHAEAAIKRNRLDGSFTYFNNMAGEIEKGNLHVNREQLGKMVEKGQLTESHYSRLLTLQAKQDKARQTRDNQINLMTKGDFVQMAQLKHTDQVKAVDAYQDYTIQKYGLTPEDVYARPVQPHTRNAVALGEMLERSRELNAPLSTSMQNLLKGMTTANKASFLAGKQLYDNISTVMSPQVANSYLSDQQKAYLAMYNLKVGKDDKDGTKAEQFFADMRSHPYKKIRDIVPDMSVFNKKIKAKAINQFSNTFTPNATNEGAMVAKYRDMTKYMLETSGGTVTVDEASDMAEKWIEQNYMQVNFGDGVSYLKTDGRQYQVGNGDALSEDDLKKGLELWRKKHVKELKQYPHFDPDVPLKLTADNATDTSKSYRVDYTNGTTATPLRVSMSDLYQLIRENKLHGDPNKQLNASDLHFKFGL